MICRGTVVADFNGDGLSDLLTSHRRVENAGLHIDWRLHPLTETGFGPTVSATSMGDPGFDVDRVPPVVIGTALSRARPLAAVADAASGGEIGNLSNGAIENFVLGAQVVALQRGRVVARGKSMANCRVLVESLKASEYDVTVSRTDRIQIGKAEHAGRVNRSCLVSARFCWWQAAIMGGFSATTGDTMCDGLCKQDLDSWPLPKDWTENVRHGVLNIIAIVSIAMLACSGILDSRRQSVRCPNPPVGNRSCHAVRRTANQRALIL